MKPHQNVKNKKKLTHLLFNKIIICLFLAKRFFNALRGSRLAVFLQDGVPNPRKDKFMKSYLAILAWLVVFTVVFSSGCEPTDPAKTDSAKSESSAVTKAPVETKTETKAEAPAETAADSVAVTINSVDITESQIEAQVKPQLERMSAQLPPVFVEQYKKQLRQKVLERIIVEQLLDEKVKAAGIVVAADDVNNLILEMAAAEKLSMEDFKALIEATGRSFEQWKQQWMQQMQIEKRLGYQKLLQAQFADKINITEDDAKKYYSENKKQFETPELLRASQILIKPDTKDPNADPNEVKARAKAKTKNLLKQIKDGADFAELAQANSSHPSAKRGGDLNFFSRGRIPPAFEKAAFGLKVGEVSDIIETQTGYHIIKVTDHKDPNVITFEQAKDDILKLLTQTREGELAKEYINVLKAKANIVYPAGKEPKADKAPPGF